MPLSLENVTFEFSPEKQMLANISFSLEEKKIYALMGSNGAGKTTLFNLLTGFIKPTKGQILFKGTNITDLKPYKINRLGIGRTFQNLRLITKLSVKENIILAMQQNPSDNWLNAMLPEYYYKKSNAILTSRAEKLVEEYFLTDVGNYLTSDISYGQQKLLSLACCVVNGATLLLLDEAVAGVQPEYRNKIAVLIKRLKEQGKTILLIEHNADFIADVADTIFFLHNGKIVALDSVEALRNEKQLMKAYV